MIITHAQYQTDDDGNNVIINATINGKILSVPIDEANRHYQAIQEWAAIEGNNIIDPGA